MKSVIFSLLIICSQPLHASCFKYSTDLALAQAVKRQILAEIEQALNIDIVSENLSFEFADHQIRDESLIVNFKSLRVSGKVWTARRGTLLVIDTHPNNGRTEFDYAIQEIADGHDPKLSYQGGREYLYYHLKGLDAGFKAERIELFTGEGLPLAGPHCAIHLNADPEGRGPNLIVHNPNSGYSTEINLPGTLYFTDFRNFMDREDTRLNRLFTSVHQLADTLTEIQYDQKP